MFPKRWRARRWLHTAASAASQSSSLQRQTFANNTKILPRREAASTLDEDHGSSCGIPILRLLQAAHLAQRQRRMVMTCDYAEKKNDEEVKMKVSKTPVAPA